MEFNSELGYGDSDKYIKTKIKIYSDSMIVIYTTNFQSKKMPKEKALCKSLLIIVLDSAIKVKKSIILKSFWKNAYVNKKR